MRLVLAFVAAALVLSACSEARPIDAIEHIVVFMQENRAFDHYYGTLKGVRGFNDRTAVPLRSGLNSFFQPTNQSDLSLYQLPWHVSALSTSATCMDAPEMDYRCDVKMYNEGRFDSWNTAREQGMGMSYWKREDLPFYFTLFDNFVVGDQYFQSTFTETNPNRLHLFSGSNGLAAGAEAVLDNTEPAPGWKWETMAETLEKAGISWKVYQQADNFDDNGFAWFANFQNAQPGDPLYDKGMAHSEDLIKDFAADMASGKLPQVSWIVGPANVSEHATWHPADGEDFTARIVKTLASYPDVYAKTAFVLNYDEGGQFYDHHWSPTPPVNESDGVSTVSTKGEVTTSMYPSQPLALGPIGLGFRVPLLVISPWTRGNIVVSQVFDHTSVIRFIEERFNVTCPNVSPWRRAISGNLLSAFNFDKPDYSWPELPDTSAYPNQTQYQCHNLPAPQIPPTQSFPQQENGTRISRALPYEFVVADTATSAGLVLSIKVTGAAGSAFKLFDRLNLATRAPQKYAVEAGKSINASLPVDWASKAYAFQLHGPNGFVRDFIGNVGSPNSLSLSATITYDPSTSSIVITMGNLASTGLASFTIVDNAYGLGGPWTLMMHPHAYRQQRFNITSSGHWYDFTVTGTLIFNPPASAVATAPVELADPEQPLFLRRFAGRMETGQDSITDPAMAAGVPPPVLWPQTQPLPFSPHAKDHPLLTDHARKFKRKGETGQPKHKDAMHVWVPEEMHADL